MFIKLLHGLHSVVGAISKYLQHWTNVDVPDNTRTSHNFKDGQGKVPAVPYDETLTSNGIASAKIDDNYVHTSDDVEQVENITRVKLRTELASGNDDLTNGIGFKNVICNPEPIIFEIQNEVPDKIEKIVPIKTQALPGQDYIFKIVYVKDYSYIEGDIMTVFGSWGTYAKLSKNGELLTVKSNADLTVRLILTPAPQDWIPEQPDPSIIQNPTDRILNTIPRDGEKNLYDIKEMKIEDKYYTVSIENQATNFVTNGEFANNKYYTVDTNTNKISIPMLFTDGFDEQALYWKCYDDPKSAYPAQGVYPTVDYNEGFGPLPERYRKLQYIYPNDNAYMDLGIKLKANYKCKALMNVSNRNDSNTIAIFGARNSTNTEWGYDDRFDGAYACYTRYYGYETIGFQRGTKKSYTSNHISSIYGQICWYYSTGTSFEVQKYDGTVIRRNTVAAAQNIDTDWNCYLFTVNDKGTPYLYGAKGNMYRFEMWDENDNLIMRLIPAKDLQTNYIGLYDIINNKFYSNKRVMGSFNGPEFYVWQKEMQTSDHENVLTLNDISPISDYNADINLPEDYYKLFGVYFPEAYIDTNYLLKKDDKVEVIAKVENNTNNNYRVLFGSKTNNSNQDSYFFYTRYSGNTYFAYNKNGGDSSSSSSVYDTIFKLVTNQTQATWYVDGIQKGQITRSGTGKDSTYTCWLGCCNAANSVESYNYCTIYSFKVYDVEDNLKLNLVPCISKLDNEIGFYDTVTNTFLKRKGGNNNLQARAIAPIVKKQLVIDNITKDINIGIIKNPVYDEPFKLDEFEDLEHLKKIDEITYNYEILDSSITDYFYVVSTKNNATDYVSVGSSYAVANLGGTANITLTYKSGYDNYDITCTPDTTATVTLGKTHYITYNELDIPASYTPIKGISNTNNSQLYFKTDYIPKWDDKIVCYASISSSYYTYPCYVFGSRNGVNNKSFVFYAHRGNNSSNMGYDRCCDEKDIRSVSNNELLKIEADNHGCLCDFAYTKTKINTEMYTVQPNPDYNPDETLPTGYMKLSGIYFRESYINTNYKIKKDDRVEVIARVDNNTNNSYRILFGARTSSYSADNYVFYTRYNYSNVPCYGKCGKETQGSSFIYGETVKIIAEPNRISWYKDDVLKGEINVTGSAVDCKYNCWIGCGNNSNNVNSWNYATFHSFKIYDKDNNLVLSYVPAKRISDNAVGFYDTISNTFIQRTSGSYALTPVEINDSIYPNNEYEMYLFNCNQAGSRQTSFYGSIYKFTVYSGDGTIKHNFVPVKRIEDSKIGFFDTINQTFFLPNGATPTEATEPTYKGNVIISDIPTDTTITFAKNDNARKPIYLEQGIEDEYERKNIDSVESNYELRDSKINDYFYTVKYKNEATNICSLAGQVATYYNVPLVGNNTRFPVTYNVGYDQEQIKATVTNGATVEITNRMKIVYENVPDEYIKIPGLYNNYSLNDKYGNSSYFEIDYKIKADETVKIWINDTKQGYTYYVFGASDSNIETNSCLLCSKYESDSNNMYYSRNKRVNITGPANEVIELECKPTGISFTNGYDDYNYNLTNTPTDCTRNFRLFGANIGGYHYSSFIGTIYKFTISNANGVTLNLLPVKRKVDGMLGFYDNIGDKFYLPNQNTFTVAGEPKFKGKIIVDNITDDCDLTVLYNPQPTTSTVETDAIESKFSFENATLSDYWYCINLNNTTNGLLTFTNQTYGNCYICNNGNDIMLPCTYKAGYTYTDFIVSEGTLNNNGITLTNIKSDKTVTVMKNDYHDPMSDTDDDLGIFTNPDFSGYDQYRVIAGSDLMLTSYSFINSQPAALSNKFIFEFNVNDLDIVSWNPTNIPGNRIKTKICCNESNMNETVQNINVNGKTLYKHTINLRTQIKLENGKVYIFKVRERTDTGKIIAYAKNTTAQNLVNTLDVQIDDNGYYFDWNESNKYIVQGNKNIYFELNGIKV